MISEQYLFISLVLLLVTGFLDITLGMTHMRSYFAIGIPLGSFGSEITASNLINAIEARKENKKFLIRKLNEQEFGFRYRFLGNWDAAMIKGLVRTTDGRRSTVKVTLNWYVLFVLITAVLSSLHFSRLFEICLLVLFVIALSAIQYHSTKKLILNHEAA
jgi:hypothetical protein